VVFCFEDELVELHKVGLCTEISEDLQVFQDLLFDNILLTSTGLRLIDVGISALKSQVGLYCSTNMLKQKGEKCWSLRIIL